MTCILTKALLVCAATLFAAWAVLANLRRIAAASDAIARIPRSRLAAFLFFAAIATLSAQKGGNTNAPPQGAMPPRVLFDGRVECVDHVERIAGNIRSTSSNESVPLFNLASETTNETYSFAMPTNAIRHGKWWLRGAYEDVFRLDLGDMAFPIGTNLCDYVWVYAWGMVGARLCDGDSRAVATGAPMSAVPSVSQFWSANTETGGKLLTWENFFLCRDTNTPVNVQMELMPSGDFIARSNLVERSFRRVNPDDWDEDGIPNDQDLQPYVYDGDNFGPHQTLPQGTNTNHYYWIDLVVKTANARVRLVGDGYSHLPDPDFIARAGETNRVTLLIGKHYEIDCAMPVEIVGLEDYEIEAYYDNGALSVEWPLSLSYVPVGQTNPMMLRSQGSSGGTTISILPSRAGGGNFSWPDNFCCYTFAAGVVPVFDCDGTCGCGGCSTGEMTYEIGGHLFSYGGYHCGCHDDDDDNPDDDDDPDDPPAGPSVSMSFSEAAVIFEDGYYNTTNSYVPKHSTEVEVSCYVYGGTNGGTFAFSLIDGGKLAKTGGSNLPRSGTIAAGDSFRVKVRYEAAAASTSVNDIRALGTFTENTTGRVLTSEDNATAVKVDVQPVIVRDGCPNRHRMGIREFFRIQLTPSSVPCVATCATDWRPPQSDSVPYQCPIRAAYNGVSMNIAGIPYTPQLTVVEPTGIVCERGWNHCASGYVAMKLDPHVSPLDVSFEGIAMMEVPTTTVGPSGYFTNAIYSSIWYHTADRGAGNWYRIGDGNYFFDDEPAFAEVCLQPFTDGSIDWEIVLGWGERDSLKTDAPVATVPTHYHQIFTIDEHGGIRIDKFGQWIKQFADGSVTNSPGISSTGGP